MVRDRGLGGWAGTHENTGDDGLYIFCAQLLHCFPRKGPVKGVGLSSDMGYLALLTAQGMHRGVLVVY